MSKSDNLFSTSFRGFSRSEVIAYIDEINRSIANTKSINDATVNDLTRELEELKGIREQNSNLVGEVSRLNAHISEQTEEISRLNTDNENQREAIIAQGEKIEGLEAEIERLKTELEQAGIKNNALEENSKQYENMLADVNGVLASARRKAEEVIRDAETRAEDIVSNAQKSAKQHVETILAESDEKVEENVKKVKYLYRRQDELAEIFKEHKDKVDSFFASIDITKGTK